MRYLGVSIVAAVMAACAVGVVVPDGATADTEVAQEVLFEIVVPASAVPDPFRTLYLEGLTVEPGVDGAIGAGNDKMRGKAMYVHAGELLIEPIADAFLWRQETRLGGTPESTPAGEPVALSTGDLILFPSVPPDEVDPDAEMRIANPGTERAVAYGFHLYDGGVSARFAVWPEGLSLFPLGMPPSISGSDIEPIAREGASLRLTRVTMSPGAVLGLGDEPLFGLYRIEDGVIEARMRGPLGETTKRWTTGSKGMATELELADWELRAVADGPTTFLELAAIPLDPDVAE